MDNSVVCGQVSFCDSFAIDSSEALKMCNYESIFCSEEEKKNLVHN